MIVTSHVGEAEAVAHLLREMKAIATKELESLSFQALDSVLSQTPPLKYSSIGVEEEPRSDVRKRTISVESDDGIINNKNSKKLASLCLCKTPVPTGPLTSLNHSDYIEHNDWSNCDALRSDPQLATSNASPAKKGAKRKSESFVGNTTKSGIVRATLRKKFSWKQYPEVSNGSLLRPSLWTFHSRCPCKLLMFKTAGELLTGKSRRLL